MDGLGVTEMNELNYGQGRERVKKVLHHATCNANELSQYKLEQRGGTRDLHPRENHQEDLNCSTQKTRSRKRSRGLVILRVIKNDK